MIKVVNQFSFSPSESQVPSLWRGLIGAWVPAVGLTGSVTKDRSPLKNDADFDGITTSQWTLSPYGWALRFDGVNDALTTKRASARYIPSGSQWSVFSYLKCNATGWNDFARVIGAKDGTNGFDVQIDTVASPRWTFRITRGGTTYWRTTTSATITMGKWSTITGVWPNIGNNHRLYIDGVLYSNTSVTGTLFGSTSKIWIGSRPDNATLNEFNGDIACVYVWDREISFSEVSLLNVDPLCLFRPRQIDLSVDQGSPAAGRMSLIGKRPSLIEIGGGLVG